MESMDTVSLQAVTLADGSTAYIQHDSKASFSDGQIMDGQVIQLEDGSAAYVQHVSMPKAGKSQTHTVTSNEIRLLFTKCHRTDLQEYIKLARSSRWGRCWSNIVSAVGGDSLQLEDGQAVQLEDGTTAYIHAPKGKK